VSAKRRTARDARRRHLGQNFLQPELARELVASAGFRPGELVVEIGAGRGALTFALARAPVDVVAVELDPVWAERLRHELRRAGCRRVRVVHADFLAFALPARPFRVIGSLPFGSTTDFCRRLFDDPSLPLERADLVVQWEVAKKRASQPPASLLSTAWAPWWEFRLGRMIPAAAFRPMPRVDAGVLVATRRTPALLPAALAAAYAGLVRTHWPFAHDARSATR
jgi:23S rRNA (adenine-N6)-dimethyltransferase